MPTSFQVSLPSQFYKWKRPNIKKKILWTSVWLQRDALIEFFLRNKTQKLFCWFLSPCISGLGSSFSTSWSGYWEVYWISHSFRRSSAWARLFIRLYWSLLHFFPQRIWVGINYWEYRRLCWLAIKLLWFWRASLLVQELNTPGSLWKIIQRSGVWEESDSKRRSNSEKGFPKKRRVLHLLW